MNPPDPTTYVLSAWVGNALLLFFALSLFGSFVVFTAWREVRGEVEKLRARVDVLDPLPPPVTPTPRLVEPEPPDDFFARLRRDYPIRKDQR